MNSQRAETIIQSLMNIRQVNVPREIAVIISREAVIIEDIENWWSSNEWVYIRVQENLNTVIMTLATIRYQIERWQVRIFNSYDSELQRLNADLEEVSVMLYNSDATIPAMRQLMQEMIETLYEYSIDLVNDVAEEYL